MATSPDSAVIDNVTNDGHRDAARGERQLLDQLAKLWHAHERQSLATYHKTGILLNEHLGPPTERQGRGKRVLQKTGERLRVSESELSRMRWLAHLFNDPADIRHGDRKIESWTQFKEALPTLKPSRGSGARKPSRGPSRNVAKTFARSLQSMSSKLLRQDDRPEDAEKALICERLQELAEAVSSRLQIPVRIIVDPEVPNPDPVKERAQRRRGASDDGGYVVSATTAVPA